MHAFNNSNFRPFLIVAFLNILHSSEEIIEPENRMSISFTVLILWPKTCNGVASDFIIQILPMKCSTT